MNIGDEYTKHVRGSRYVFSSGNLYYRYPNGSKHYAQANFETIVKNLEKAGKRNGGRLIVNEECEIVTYNQIEPNRWRPYYAGKLPREIAFDDVDNNPKNLKAGLLWTGFISNHGSVYKFNQKGKIFFPETILLKSRVQTTRYNIINGHEKLMEQMNNLYKNYGRFHLNEHGHIWIPVEGSIVRDNYDKSAINKQFKKLTPRQKKTLSYYSSEKYNAYTKRRESYYPIYAGKCEQCLVIERPVGCKDIYRDPDQY